MSTPTSGVLRSKSPACAAPNSFHAHKEKAREFSRAFVCNFTELLAIVFLLLLGSRTRFTLRRRTRLMFDARRRSRPCFRRRPRLRLRRGAVLRLRTLRFRPLRHRCSMVLLLRRRMILRLRLRPILRLLLRGALRHALRLRLLWHALGLWLLRHRPVHRLRLVGLAVLRLRPGVWRRINRPFRAPVPLVGHAHHRMLRRHVVILHRRRLLLYAGAESAVDFSAAVNGRRCDVLCRQRPRFRHILRTPVVHVEKALPV